MDFILTSLSEGILWSIMAIGVYMTFRILDIADLTAEGAYPLGAAVTASQLVQGTNPWLATFYGFGAGVLAGLVSGLLHTKLGIPALLTGIITLTGLFSVNLLIMGKANLSLVGQETIYSQVQALGLTKAQAVFGLGLLAVLIIVGLLTLLMKTEIGLVLRSTGDNIPMSEANGVSVDAMKILGYMISNGLISLCGALLVQNYGFSDVSSGTGTIVIGLASVILAEVLVRDLTIGWRLLSIMAGGIVYRLIILNILEIPNMDTNLVKLFNAILLAVILFVPELQKRLKIRPVRVTK